MTLRIGPIVCVAMALLVIVKGCGGKDANDVVATTVQSKAGQGKPVHGKPAPSAKTASSKVGALHTFSAPIAAAVLRGLDDERATGWVTLVRKKPAPLKISAAVKQECAPSPLTTAIGAANRGEGDILVELRPVACDGMKASVRRMSGRDLAAGLVRLPALAAADKKTCVATFEACLASKGAASCVDQRTEGLLFSVPIVAQGRTVKAFAASETRPDKDPLAVLQTKLSAVGRIAVGTALTRARLSADLNLKGSTLGVELGYRTRAACSGETLDVASAGSRKP